MVGSYSAVIKVRRRKEERQFIFVLTVMQLPRIKFHEVHLRKYNNQSANTNLNMFILVNK
jgi:hypothetical protein